jgi:hypothetical protein
LSHWPMWVVEDNQLLFFLFSLFGEFNCGKHVILTDDSTSFGDIFTGSIINKHKLEPRSHIYLRHVSMYFMLGVV